MGVCTSRNQVIPGTTAISVVPAPQTNLHSSASSASDSQNQLSNSFNKGRLSSSGSGSQQDSSRPISCYSRRPTSRSSTRSMGKGAVQSGLRRVGSGIQRMASHHSGVLSSSFGKGDKSFYPTKVEPFTPGDLLTQSKHFKSRQESRLDASLVSDTPVEGGVYFLRALRLMEGKSSSGLNCPSCGSKFQVVVHIPYLLLCGHTYCSSCIDKAIATDVPSFLKCGMCCINTPVDPQVCIGDFDKNEAILSLLESKEFVSAVANSRVDPCAECEKEPAVMYCSECSASYCQHCNKQQHSGSKVRSRHKPVSINLKPRPQPTCKKHPGQSCVLYCETERQPMCVLCKFYGQHRSHNFQLLNNAAASYRTSLIDKSAQLDKLEAQLSRDADAHAETVQDIRNKAMEAQDKLEKHFAETRDELIAVLEHREALLLCLLDKQVEKRERMLKEQRMELAAARARALATKEEASQLLQLNPVSALIARNHMDKCMDTILKQTATFSPGSRDGKEGKATTQLLTVGLMSKNELATRLQSMFSQHGAVLQLPEKPIFSDLKITTNLITLCWQLPNQNLEVTADRTQVFSLQCFADVPFKFKKEKLMTINKRFLSSAGMSPESGFYDPSEVSSQQSEERSGLLPSIPPSLLGSRTISLVTMNSVLNKNQVTEKLDENQGQGKEGAEKSSHEGRDDRQQVHSMAVGSIGGPVPPQKVPSSVKAMFSEPLRAGQPRDPPAEPRFPLIMSCRDHGSAHASALLSLPPLLTKTNEDGKTKVFHHAGGNMQTNEISSIGSEADMFLDSNGSGILADAEDTPRPNQNKVSANTDDVRITSRQISSRPTEDSSSTLSDSSDEQTENFISMGRFCKGFAFEEIYCGHNCRFQYSGVVTGATYYFRVRCRNAAGDGPWSDAVKCSVTNGRKS